MVDPIIVPIKTDTRSVDKSLANTQREVDKTTKSAKGLSTSLSEVKFLAVAGFAAVAAGAATSVKAFATFDNELRGVKTLLNENSFGAKGLEKGFADMTDQVKDLGRRVPVDLGAMNKALFDTVSAGVAASQAVGVLEVSARLAVAGLTDVSTATDGMTSALNAYGLGAEDAEEVASKFFAAQKAGKTTISELSSGFGLVGASAKAYGVTLDELLSAVSAVTTAGVKTNSAYTGLNAVLAGIAKPTAEAAKEAKRLNIEFSSTALRTLKLKGFLDQLTQSAGFNNTSIEKLFGSVEAQKIAFALTGTQAGTFAETLDNLGKKQETLNTFTDAYKTSADSLQNQLKLAGNQVDLLKIAIGTALAPQVLLITKYWTNFINELGKDDAPVKVVRKISEINDEIGSLETKITELKGSGIFNDIMDLNSMGGDTGVLQTSLQEKFDTISEFENQLLVLREELAAKIAEEKAIEAQKEAEHQSALKKIKDDARKKENEDNAKNNILKDKDIERSKARAEKAAKAQLAFDRIIGQQRIALAGNISGLITQVLGSENKAAFLISKAAAAAQLAIGTGLALAMVPAQTAAIPYPGNFAAAAQMKGYIMANAAVSAATIAAATIQGFQDGGFVGGNSFSGDKQIIGTNSGEAVLTSDQQREFMALANGGGSGGSEIVLTLKDNLVDFIEAELIERNALRESR